MEYAPIATADSLEDLVSQVDQRLGDITRDMHASSIGITVPRDNLDSGAPTDLTIQEVLLPLIGGASSTSTAKVIDAESVLGGATWEDLTDGGESSGHHHDSLYVNVTGDTMTGDLSIGGKQLLSVGHLAMTAVDDKIQWSATRYLTGTNGLELHDGTAIYNYAPITYFIGTALDANMVIQLRRLAAAADSYIAMVGVADYLITGSLAGDLILYNSQSSRSIYMLASTTGAFEVHPTGLILGNGAATNYTFAINAGTSDYLQTWDTTNDVMYTSDAWLFGDAAKVYLEASGHTKGTESLGSDADGYLDYAAATAHRFDTLIDLVATTATAGQITQGGTRLLHTYGTDNLFLGSGAGNFTTSGLGENIGIGGLVLDALTDGRYNIGVGHQALTDLNSGTYNVAVGRQAGWNITSGDRNVALGSFALATLTTGDNNIAVGDQAAFSVTGSNMTAIGYGAGYTNTNGGGVYLGSLAGFYETAANKFFIDNAARTNEADGRVKALQYGIFAAATADQYLTINGHLYAREDSLMIDAAKWQFRDTEINISSKSDSYLDLEADGAVRINTNAWFEADGTQVASGAATTYDDIYMAFEGAHVPAANNPTWTAWIGNVSAYVFAVNDYLDLEATELSHTYLEDSNFEFHVHWSTNGLEGAAKYVKWEIEYSIANTATTGAVGDTFPATTVVSAETEIPASTADRKNMYTTIATVTGTNFKMGAIIKMRVRRIASAGTAPVANPFGLMAGVHIEQDTDGSRAQRVK